MKIIWGILLLEALAFAKPKKSDPPKDEPKKTQEKKTEEKKFEAKLISSFNEIKLENIPANSMVVTDINDTLVQCKDQRWSKEQIKSLPDPLPNIQKNLTSSAKNYLANLLLLKCINQPIADSVAFFSQLKHKQIPAVALTAAFSEKFEDVEMKEKISHEMMELGFSFLDHHPDKIELVNLPLDYISLSHPIFYRGILFSSGVTNGKGKIFWEFLVDQHITPDHVIFVDDSLDNLKTFVKEMQPSNIPIDVFQLQSPPSNFAPITKPEEIEGWKSIINQARWIDICSMKVKCLVQKQSNTCTLDKFESTSDQGLCVANEKLRSQLCEAKAFQLDYDKVSCH